MVDRGCRRLLRPASGASFLDLAFSASGTFLVALENNHDLTTFATSGDGGRSVGNGLKGDALFNEVLFP